MITPEALARFSTALDALCEEHGVILTHEDSQGSGLVLDPADYPGQPRRSESWIHLEARGRL